MRLLYIDQYFSTHQGVSGTRSFDLARALARRGHSVTVLTSRSRYWLPDGGRATSRRQHIEGLDVVALNVDYAARMGRGQRLAAFARFALAACALGPLLGRYDVVFSSSTPLSVGLPGVFNAALRGAPHVFEVRDLWPAVPAALGEVRGLALRIAQGLERWIYANSAAVVALSPGMARGVIQAGVADWKVTLIPNLCNTELFPGAPDRGLARELGIGDKRVVLYAGAMGPANGLDALLDLAAQVQSRGRNDVLFVLAGDGPSRQALQARADELKLENLRLIDPLPRQRMPGLFALSALTLTVFAENKALEDNSPNKLFDSLAAGRPSLVNRPGWTAELVENSGAGFRLDTTRPQAAADALLALLDDPQRLEQMGRVAATLAQGELNLEQAADKLERTLSAALEAAPRYPLQRAVKTLIERLAVATALVVLTPLLLLIGLAIRLESPGPALFRMERSGRYGFRFRPLKFRSMVQGAAQAGAGLNLEQDDARITRVGRVLRRYSLDELPQLIDVLLGRMSLVGPRPMLPQQAALLDQRQRRRLVVRPGITGWAQVNGRNLLSWPQRVELDLEYVERWSLWLDCRIIWRTLSVVLKGQGLHEPDAGRDDPFNTFEERDD